MKYIIHNKHMIQPESQQVLFEAEVLKKVKELEKVLKNYKKELILDIFLKEESKRPESAGYDISVSLALKSKPLVVEGHSREPVLLVNELLDKLRRLVKDQRALERQDYLYKRKRRQSEKLTQQVDKLAAHKKENNRQAFTDLLAENLPAIRNYIRRRLKMARATGLLKNQVISVEELLDEAYLRVYDLFNTKPDIAEHLLPWMYQVADDVLEEKLKEIDFEKKHVTDLDKIVRSEIKSMEEKFTVDAEPDLIMMEELDDPSYNSQYYPADIILKDDADEKILRAVEKLDEKEIHNAISRILAGLPALQRSVFDIYWLEGLEPSEIAFIKRISEKEVKDLLEDTRRVLLERLAETE